MLSGKFDWKVEQEAASTVVRNYYAVPVVTLAHTEFIREVLAGA